LLFENKCGVHTDLKKSGIKKIAITGSTRIGDLVVMIPFLAKLRKTFPESEITMITWKNESPEFTKEYPYLDNIIEMGDKKLLLLKNNLKVRSQKFDYLLRGVPIDSSGGFVSHYLIKADIKERCRISREDYHKNGVIAHKMWLRMLDRIGIQTSEEDNIFPPLFHYSREDRKKIDDLLAEANAGRKNILIGIHMLSGKNLETRSWSYDKWAQLMNHLYKAHDPVIIFLGGTDVVSQSREFIEKLDFKILDLTGKLALKETALILEKVNVLICINSGIMNMASAMNVPMVCLSGPTTGMWKPFSDKSIEVRKTIDRKHCNPPCDVPACSWNDNKCMEDIEVKDVIDSVEKIISS